MVRRKSAVWCFFKPIDAESAQCLLCMDYRVKQGTTTNMLRHLRTKHPAEVVKKLKGRVPETTSISGGQGAMNTDSEQFCFVEVELEDGDSDTLTTRNDADFNEAVNGILEAAKRGPAEQVTHEEASDARPVRRRRSLIWRYYDRLDSLGAARCRICMKKLQCFESGSTSNLHRHMSKRHPEVFSRLGGDRQNPTPSQSSQGSNVKGGASTAPETERRPFPDEFKASRVSARERRVLSTERELINSLRRAQREEARALEDQRELLEKLRAVDARTAAAEREQIESLRKVQLEEAKQLRKQKEELQEEKAELQKKWEELQQEKEKLSREQQASYF
ncbi:uncharacterized protein LOC143318936 [Chaetodon auriga]|uniref:uncharacterized protein LOC143318936 n=1 Tax=Chaetodon auriga TaxID=39042 RepID=UPI004032FEDA